MQESSSIHFACRFPWVKCFAPSKAKLKHLVLAATLCQNTPAHQANTSYHQVKNYETLVTVSASLTTFLSRARINRAIRPHENSAESRHWIEKERDTVFPSHIDVGEIACFILPSRYHHILYYTVRCLHLNDHGSKIRMRAPLYPC